MKWSCSFLRVLVWHAVEEVARTCDHPLQDEATVIDLHDTQDKYINMCTYYMYH